MKYKMWKQIGVLTMHRLLTIHINGSIDGLYEYTIKYL